MIHAHMYTKTTEEVHKWHSNIETVYINFNDLHTSLNTNMQPNTC